MNIRNQCLRCYLKHISQAKTLLLEYVLDPILYSTYFDDAIGHMAEAENETSQQFTDLAIATKDARVAMMQSDEQMIIKNPNILSLDRVNLVEVINKEITWPDFDTLQKAARILLIQEISKNSEPKFPLFKSVGIVSL